METLKFEITKFMADCVVIDEEFESAIREAVHLNRLGKDVEIEYFLAEEISGEFTESIVNQLMEAVYRYPHALYFLNDDCRRMTKEFIIAHRTREQSPMLQLMIGRFTPENIEMLLNYYNVNISENRFNSMCECIENLEPDICVVHFN